MWIIAVLLALTASAATFNVEPAAAKQGDAIRVSAPPPADGARMNGRTIKLFPQPDGSRLGLMPVSANYKPGNYLLEYLDSSGKVLQRITIPIRDAGFPEQDVKLSRRTQAIKPAPGEMETVAAFRNTVSDTRFWSDAFTRPVPGCMVSAFGLRRLYNGRNSGNYHGGLDLRGAAGTPVEAMADGVVRLVKPFNVHGNIVGIDHGQGVVSMYLHLSRFATTEGAKVRKGEVIGFVGSTGRSTAPHLHWAVAVNGVMVNPAQWVPVDACPKPPQKRRTPRRNKPK